MKPWQKAVKYCAIAFAVILVANIVGWTVTIFGAIFGTSSVIAEESQSFEFDADVYELEIKISAASFTLRAEECDGITVKTNLKNLTAKESGGRLRVKEKSRFLTVTDSDAFIEIVYPLGLDFDKVEIIGGAGRLTISSLTADKLKLELGAGETVIESLTVEKEADIDGGAGALTFKDSSINDLDLDMGVGELSYSGRLSGKNEISLGVGEAHFELEGSKNDYSLDLEKGIGDVKVDGTSVGNSEIGDGDTRIEIDGGVGNIVIDFKGANVCWRKTALRDP